MGSDTLTFKLGRVAHGSRNLIDNFQEDRLQAQAKLARMVMVPGVDIATAWAMVDDKPGGLRARRVNVFVPPAISMRQLNQQLLDAEAHQAEVDLAVAETGWAVLIPEAWPSLHHLVRYFDLIEQNEAPDTSLLEWLVTAGVVRAQRVRAAVVRFQKPTVVGHTTFVLNPVDAERLRMAADVRTELEAEERAADR